MVPRSALPLLTFALVLGCGSLAYQGGVRTPDRRAMVRLERQAQRDMQCRAPLRVVALEPRAFQVDGCGQMREYAWVCPGRRCAFQPIVPAVVRASEDLQCAPGMLAGTADAPTHRAFFGCTRGAAYTLMCLDHGCTWTRTQEAVTIAGAAAPVAPTVSVAVAPSVGDPVLAEIAVPPPPGAPSPFAPAPPPPPSAVPAPGPAPVPPPPATPTDSVVIPPPPA